MAVAHASRLPWLSIAPFGSPVVPLVNTISARVAPSIGAAGRGSARRARSGRASIQTIGRPRARADASVWREARTSFAPVCWTILRAEIDRVADVERDRDAAGVGDGQEREAPFRSVDGPDDRPVADAQPCIGEDAGGTGDGRGQVPVAPASASGTTVG